MSDAKGTFEEEHGFVNELKTKSSTSKLQELVAWRTGDGWLRARRDWRVKPASEFDENLFGSKP
jgi:hypothetical protein